MNQKFRPLVSIAMTTYNGAEFLDEQIESILKQTYENFELIICDDVSSDETLEIIKQIQSRDSRIKLYENRTRLGIVKNFEKAIGLCRGHYIALSDQDDIWLENKVEKLANAIGDNLLVHSDACLIDSMGGVIADSYTAYSGKVIYPENLIDVILNGYVTGGTALFARELLGEILPFPENIYIHDKWIGTVAFLYDKIIYIDQPLIKYRQHSGNAIGAEKIEDISLLKKIWKIRKNRRHYRNNSLFKAEMQNQLEFTETIYNKFKNAFKDFPKRKMILLIAYFKDAASRNLKLKAFFIRLLLFRHFEMNKSFKFRCFELFKVLFF